VNTVMPESLMAEWRAMFAAAFQEGHPGADPAAQGEAWRRFLEGLPALLLRHPAGTRAEVAVAAWLFEEYAAQESAAAGLVACYRPRAGGGILITWTTAGGYFGTDSDPTDN
jgi:hypothetical protein